MSRKKWWVFGAGLYLVLIGGIKAHHGELIYIRYFVIASVLMLGAIYGQRIEKFLDEVFGWRDE